MRFYIETYGCTLNQHDSELMREILLKKGNVETDENSADVIIVNTCGVKDATEKRIVQRLKGIGKPLVVGGCIASADEKLVRRFAPHATIIGTGSVAEIENAIEDAMLKGKGDYANADAEDKGQLSYPFVPPIAIVAISDGCTSACTYCFTKLARPGLKSMRSGEVLKRIKMAEEAGVRELRLTSQDMGAYGLERGTSLKNLLKQIADTGPDLRIRIGMMNPKHLKEQMEVVDLIMENECFYKFFHIPVQSGSDAVLKEMKRENGVEDYLQIVREIRRDKSTNIMNDLIVGFPGESEEDFEMSLELAKKVMADTTNVSKFSARPGTEAAVMEQLDRRVIKERSKEMSILCDAISEKRNEMWVGKECEITLLEKMRGIAGRNDYYKQVIVDGKEMDGNKQIAANGKGMKIGERIRVKLISAGVAYIKGKRIRQKGKSSKANGKTNSK
jgi:MiaB-like tRNA modifying enzyme